MMTKQELIQEKSTYEFLAEGLTQEHQESVKNDLLRKVESLQYQIDHYDDDGPVMVSNYDSNCKICHGKGYFKFNSCVAGGEDTQMCHCNLFKK